jgi:hypothetical protein
MVVATAGLDDASAVAENVGVQRWDRGRLKDLVFFARNAALTFDVQPPGKDNTLLVDGERVVCATSDRNNVAQVEFFGEKA